PARGAPPGGGASGAPAGRMGRPAPPRRLREAAEELEAAQVEAARKAGATWLEIGACYGLTKQGAQQRFRAARKQAEAEAASRAATKPAATTATTATATATRGKKDE